MLLPARLGGAEPASAIERVYQSFILIKTLAALLDKTTIDLPEDVRPLVESVYDDVMPDGATLERIGVSEETAGGAWADRESSRQVAADAARRFVLGPPHGDRFTAGERVEPRPDDDEVLERHSIIGAQTRLSGPSARIVFVEHDDVRLRDDSVVMRDARLHDELARELLDRGVSISHNAMLDHIQSGHLGRQPKSFSRTPSLRSYTLLRTVEGVYEWQAKGRAYRLTIDEEYGVVIEEVDGVQ